MSRVGREVGDADPGLAEGDLPEPIPIRRSHGILDPFVIT
jgi:hypothetical protein